MHSPLAQSFDVIIVGAGPAGATAAWYLAHESCQQGRPLKVALLEKARFPRDKFCGDAWCAPALDILEEMGVLQPIMADGLYQDTTSGGFVSPSGENYMTRAGGEAEISQKNRTFAIKRMICDERIARRAAEVGADLIEEAQVTEAQLGSDGLWQVRCSDGRQFHSRMLLAADGATSRLARSLGVVETPPNAAAARQYVKGGTHNYQAGGVLLFPEYILPGYVALFRHYNDDIDLGAYIIPGGAARVEDAARIYETHILKDPFIQRVLGPNVEFLEAVRTASLRMGGEPRSTAAQFMAIGDAAGQTDPLTGEGIHTAMIAARLAARRVLEMFASDGYDAFDAFNAAACEVYHQRWMAAFGKDFKSSALSARMSYRYPFFLDAAAVLAERSAGRFMETFGAIMTGVEPKSAYAKPDVALPLMRELGRQFWRQKILRQPHGWAAYQQKAEENPLRASSFAAVCLRDAHITAQQTAAVWSRPAASQNSGLQFASADHHARPLLVLYATEYGYSKGVAQQLAEHLSQLNAALADQPLSPRVLAVDAYQRIDWAQEKLAFFICPTAGDGEFPLQAREFVQALEENLPLSTLRYAVLACGDSAYPNFCQAGHELHELLQKNGAQALLEPLEVDQEDDSAVAEWLAEIDALFNETDLLSQLPTLAGKSDYLLANLAGDEGEDPVSAQQPLTATLLERHVLTSAGPADESQTATQEVLSLTLDLYGNSESRRIDWQPGDALGVLAHNPDALVEAILAYMSVGGDTILGVLSQIMTLREGLQRHLDIKTLSRGRISKFAAWISDAAEQQRWQALVQAAGSEAEAARNYLLGRELIDLLDDFPVTARQLDSVQWMSFLPRLQPRYYSIASSPLVRAEQLTLCVARLHYTSHGRPRAGLASNYLGHELAVGSRCSVFLKANPAFRPPALSAPVGPVMIGPGTGVAPFRGFMQHLQEQARREGKRLDEIWPAADAPALFFGCRRAQQDFLYRELWQNWQAAGCLQLYTAFSRQQSEKIYVQHRLREQAALIWQRFERGATFYICGDATRMAGDVEQALLDIIMQQGQQTAEEAKNYLAELARQGRYLKDVWA
ncbi:MAG: flavodoxin domain-containing protein [Sterolibacterium sp.]|nr:flavodoxin domain-containing protein [Sterolibacterium sp.]